MEIIRENGDILVTENNVVLFPYIFFAAYGCFDVNCEFPELNQSSL